MPDLVNALEPVVNDLLDLKLQHLNICPIFNFEFKIHNPGLINRAADLAKQIAIRTGNFNKFFN